MTLTDVTEITYSHDLAQALTALGVPWTTGQPSNGRQGTLIVPMDNETDARLEHLVGDLSDLRWHYQPGRRLQLAFDLEV